jgi:hypothetical protein
MRYYVVLMVVIVVLWCDLLKPLCSDACYLTLSRRTRSSSLIRNSLRLGGRITWLRNNPFPGLIRFSFSPVVAYTLDDTTAAANTLTVAACRGEAAFASGCISILSCTIVTFWERTAPYNPNPALDTLRERKRRRRVVVTYEQAPAVGQPKMTGTVLRARLVDRKRWLWWQLAVSKNLLMGRL